MSTGDRDTDENDINMFIMWVGEMENFQMRLNHPGLFYHNNEETSHNSNENMFNGHSSYIPPFQKESEQRFYPEI